MRAAVLTSAGGRPENQDAAGYALSPGGVVACVCDGLGGHGGGRIAAQVAKDAILREGGSPGERIARANLAVIAAHGEFPSMRTTALALEVSGGEARWAHCGDTRLYRIRGGGIEQLTLDHSVPQMLVRTGEIAPEDIRHHEDRARLTRALGTAEARWDENRGGARAGDVYLMMTDGFWEPVLEARMLACVREGPEDTLRAMEQILLGEVAGEYDNYTALAVFV